MPTKKRKRGQQGGRASSVRAAPRLESPMPGRGSGGAWDRDEANDEPPGRMGRTTTTGTAGGPKAPR